MFVSTKLSASCLSDALTTSLTLLKRRWDSYSLTLTYFQFLPPLWRILMGFCPWYSDASLASSTSKGRCGGLLQVPFHSQDLTFLENRRRVDRNWKHVLLHQWKCGVVYSFIFRHALSPSLSEIASGRQSGSRSVPRPGSENEEDSCRHESSAAVLIQEERVGSEIQTFYSNEFTWINSCFRSKAVPSQLYYCNITYSPSPTLWNFRGVILTKLIFTSSVCLLKDVAQTAFWFAKLLFLIQSMRSLIAAWF